MGEAKHARYEESSAGRPAPRAEAPRRRRSSRQGSRTRTARKRLRIVYFVLASSWGFVAGTAAVLAGLASMGRPLHLQPATGGLLVGAGLLAVVGGFVAAVAYHEASKRL